MVHKNNVLCDPSYSEPLLKTVDNKTNGFNYSRILHEGRRLSVNGHLGAGLCHLLSIGENTERLKHIFVLFSPFPP